MKNEGLILNIETSTTVCSVALSRRGSIIASEETDGGYTHAENLHLFIDRALKSAGLKPGDLDAVALSSGPGSYTGLRIGSSTAKGMCYALGIPLISIDTLQLLAASGVGQKEAPNICAMLDAGRMEVYTAVYDHRLSQVHPVEALILDENSIKKFDSLAPIVFLGPGMEKAKKLLEGVKAASFLDGVKPSAKNMSGLAHKALNEQKFVEVRDFEPFYLKNFIAGKPKKA